MRAADLDARYPARRMLDLVGARWTAVLLYCLADGPQRFNALHRRMPDISRKVLVQALRRLERDGLLERRAGAGTPAPVDYRLTALDIRLHEPIGELCRWAARNADALDAVAARRAGAAPGP